MGDINIRKSFVKLWLTVQC